MAYPSVFPTSIDSYTLNTDGIDDVLAADVNELQSAIVAIETKLGIGALTAGRLPFVSAAGGITDSANAMLNDLGDAYFAGKVGVGITPSYKLDIYSDSGAIDKTLNVRNAENSGTMYAMSSVADGVSGTSHIAAYFSASGAINNYGLLVNAGKVGFGTVTPAREVVINEGSLQFTNATTGAAAGDGFQILLNGATVYLEQQEAASMILRTNGIDRLTIASGGGITTSGEFGCNGATAQTRLTVTGSRGGNAALASLLTQLVAFGFITDSTS